MYSITRIKVLQELFHRLFTELFSKLHSMFQREIYRQDQKKGPEAPDSHYFKFQGSCLANFIFPLK